MFPKVLFNGENVFDVNEDGMSYEDDKTDINEVRMISVGQDLVYNASKKKMRTGKHVGLASRLHKTTV